MSLHANTITAGFRWKNLFQYFVQGLVVLAPVSITIYVVMWLFSIVDNILPDIVAKFFPKLMKEGTFEIFPGVGFIVVVLIVLIAGRLSSIFFINRLMQFLDYILEHTPGIRFIYTATKDFFGAFAGNKKKFNKAVLVNVDGADIWRIGFITQYSAARFEMDEHLVVYVPHSYAISGITYIVPKEKIKSLINAGSADAMKFVLSGGVTESET